MTSASIVSYLGKVRLRGSFQEVAMVAMWNIAMVGILVVISSSFGLLELASGVIIVFKTVLVPWCIRTALRGLLLVPSEEPVST